MFYVCVGVGVWVCGWVVGCVCVCVFVFVGVGMYICAFVCLSVNVPNIQKEKHFIYFQSKKPIALLKSLITACLLL